MKNICIDIDGTITDPYYFIPYLNKLTGQNKKKEDYTSVDWNDVFGSKYSYIYNNFDEDYGYIYEEAPVISDSIEVINKIKKENNIFFVTARNKCVENITLNWLKNYGFNYSELFSLSGNESKLKVAIEKKCDIFIEDDPNNALKLAENGIKVILLNTNYNKNISHENITRVDNWQDINEIINY